jgi:hypothetical protein
MVMTTIADFNYVMGVLEAGEYQQKTLLANFSSLKSDGERAAFLKNLTNMNDLKKQANKAVEGVNKGTAQTVKATKAAAELAASEGVSLNTVEPNREGKIGVEEVKAAVQKTK